LDRERSPSIENLGGDEKHSPSILSPTPQESSIKMESPFHLFGLHLSKASAWMESTPHPFCPNILEVFALKRRTSYKKKCILLLLSSLTPKVL
jgi:hypothetical protein